MVRSASLIVLLIIYVQMIALGNGERTKDKMYATIKTTMACFRRMNGTHQTGCTSSRRGSTGIIHFVEKESDVDALLKNGKAGQYVPVLPTDLLTREIIDVLKKSDIVSGIVIYKKNATVDEFSGEAKCPNQNSVLSNTCDRDWNKVGTGLLQEDFPFPIFLVTDGDSVRKIRRCFKKFNDFDYELQKERSLCSLELNSFMFATTDTPTCLRRSNSMKNINPVKFCDPMGDKNVWASLYPIRNDTEAKDGSRKYVVVAAKLDGTSLFNEMLPGAVSPLTGLVSLLATANLLKTIMPKTQTFGKNVLYVLFNGETYDYIGSQRFVYDMSHDEFPIKIEPYMKRPMPPVHFDDIGLYVELSQLSKNRKIFVHRRQKSSDVEVNGFVDILTRNNDGPEPFATVLDAESDTLPPASLHTFLKENLSFPGLVLADHELEYANKYYNSIYDDAANVDYKYYNVSGVDDESIIPKDSIQRYVANVSKLVAYGLYEQITGHVYNGTDVSQVQLVDELFNCYLLSANCKIHRAVFKREFDSDKPFSLYVGVTISPNVVTDLTGLTLAWLTGDTVENRTESNCTGDPYDPAYQYFMMAKDRNFFGRNETECVRTTMNFTSAFSPAFLIEDYDWKSGKYSSWTESTWRELNVRMFLKPSAKHEAVTLTSGSTVMVLSMIVVYFVKSRAHILFSIPDDSPPTSC